MIDRINYAADVYTVSSYWRWRNSNYSCIPHHFLPTRGHHDTPPYSSTLS